MNFVVLESQIVSAVLYMWAQRSIFYSGAVSVRENSIPGPRILGPLFFFFFFYYFFFNNICPKRKIISRKKRNWILSIFFNVEKSLGIVTFIRVFPSCGKKSLVTIPISRFSIFLVKARRAGFHRELHFFPFPKESPSHCVLNPVSHSLSTFSFPFSNNICS